MWTTDRGVRPGESRQPPGPKPSNRRFFSGGQERRGDRTVPALSPSSRSLLFSLPYFPRCPSLFWTEWRACDDGRPLLGMGGPQRGTQRQKTVSVLTRPLLPRLPLARGVLPGPVAGLLRVVQLLIFGHVEPPRPRLVGPLSLTQARERLPGRHRCVRAPSPATSRPHARNATRKTWSYIKGVGKFYEHPHNL